MKLGLRELEASEMMHKHFDKSKQNQSSRVTEVRKGVIHWRNGHSGHTMLILNHTKNIQKFGRSHGR